MTPNQTIRTLALAGAVGVLAPQSAFAEVPAPVVDMYGDCTTQEQDCGPKAENAGPGHEQAKGAAFVFEGNTYVYSVVMSARAIPNRDQGPYQGRLYGFRLDPVMGLVTVLDGKLISNNRGNRPFNHPDLAYLGDGKLLVQYGTNDDNNANVQPYAQQFSMQGDPLGARTNLGDNNGNDGAASCLIFKDASGAVPTAYPKRFACCYNDNGTNADCTIAAANADGTITKLEDVPDIIDPANIPRCSLTQYSPTHFLGCCARGDQRPPELGNFCRVVTTDGDKVGGQQAVMRSNLNVNPRVYANNIWTTQPTAFGQPFYVMNTTSSGTGRNNNTNGLTTVYGGMLNVKPDHTIELIANTQITGVGGTVHSTIVAGRTGTAGVYSGGIVQGAIRANGAGTFTPIEMNVATGAMTQYRTIATSSGLIDTGYYANLYGNNPNTQGRDFMSAIGDVQNPGYGVTGGFMPSVKSFFAVFHNGKETEEDYKISAYISLVPAEYDPTVLPPDEDPENPENPEDPENPGNGDDNSGTGSSGGCSVGGDTGSSIAGLVLLLGAVLVVRRRRRK